MSRWWGCRAGGDASRWAARGRFSDADRDRNVSGRTDWSSSKSNGDQGRLDRVCGRFGGGDFVSPGFLLVRVARAWPRFGSALLVAPRPRATLSMAWSRLSESVCRYRSVVAMLVWPKSAWTSRSEAPFLSAYVAKV